mmetsp:Transcript_19283/g.41829  ORF Transcript_19283/g.41829 Transcript_19283/m.41829 type:complete len:739 (-) Transcript_19283:197-2413(-)
MRPRRMPSHAHQRTGFLLPTSTSSRRRRSSACRHDNLKSTIAANLTPDETTTHCYVPPYGMVPRQSSIVMNMMVNDGYSDDRFRKKMNSKRTKDPVIQDFGNMRDWQASKTGLGRMGDDKVGDDGVSERFGPGGGMGMGGPGMDMGYENERIMYNNENGGMDDRFDLMEQQQQQQRQRPPPVFEGDGGNFWVNPSNSMDQYPSRNQNEGMMPRPRGGRRRNNSGKNTNDDYVWPETRRNEQDYDDELFDDFDDEYEEGGYRGEYGVPPPTRSRSSFRSGAPPPPRPVKSFYDKLFWFGFDPDVTRSTDRTMFGGTRGKFNAMDLLNDREERQRIRGGGEGRRMRGNGNRRMRGGGRGGLSTRSGKGPVIQDFGSVRDWNDRKTGQGRAGGEAVGDDSDRPNYGYDAGYNDGMMGGPAPFPGDMGPPPPPMGMPDYDFDATGYNNEDFLMDGGDMDFEEERRGSMGRRQRSDRGGRRRQREGRRRSSMDSRAQEYNQFLGLGPPPPDVDDYVMDNEYNMPRSMSEGRGPRSSTSSRRRKGFAYKYNDIDLFDDDGEYIDVEPKYASERDLDMARGIPPPNNNKQQRRRRPRSWEDRAIEMDRVPPRNAVAWGPNGRIGASGETNPLDRAAMEALGDIQKMKRFLERKEEDVEDAKEEVVSLKADASFCEDKLQDTRGREASKLEQELGYILRDVEDASRNLRMARAERDAASERVSDLEERNWALLSEYEAARSFEEEM